ncbi:sodium-dependent dopamine transporter-like [Haemaphysalis longicornis]
MPPVRELWSSTADCFVCCLNLCIGIGDVSTLPYLVYHNGGLVFIAVYGILLCAMGIPMLYLEIFLGQFSGCSMPGAFGGFPMAKGVGWTMVYAAVCLSLYNAPLIAECFVYLASSLQNELPWNTCLESDVEQHGCYQIQHGAYPCNKVNATLANRYSSQNYSGKDGVVVGGGENPVVVVPLEEYADLRGSCINGTDSAAQLFYHQSLMHFGVTQDTAYHPGGTVSAMVVVCTLGFLVIFLGTYFVKKASTVVLFIQFSLLALLCVLGSMLTGARSGIAAFLTPDLSKAFLLETWYSAAHHMFFSLDLSVGVITFFASRNDFHWPIFGTALKVAICDLLFGLFAGSVAFSLYGHLEDSFAVPIADKATKDVDYLFVTFPEIIQPLNHPHIWAVAFYVTVTVAVCGTQFCYLAAMLDSLRDLYPVVGDRSVLSSFVACLGAFVIGLPLAILDEGEGFREFVNRIVKGNFMFLVGIAEVLFIAYGYGAGRLVNDIVFMFDARPPVFLPFCWRFVCPVILALTGIGLLTGDAHMQSVASTSPQWASPAEIAAFAAIIILFGAFALDTLAKNNYDLYAALQPQQGYGPKDPGVYSRYQTFLSQRNAGPADETAKPPAPDVTGGVPELPAPGALTAGPSEMEDNGAGTVITRSESVVVEPATVVTAPEGLTTVGTTNRTIEATTGAAFLDAANTGAEPTSTGTFKQC